LERTRSTEAEVKIGPFTNQKASLQIAVVISLKPGSFHRIVKQITAVAFQVSPFWFARGKLPFYSVILKNYGKTALNIFFQK
jgi:hypothetical protein